MSLNPMGLHSLLQEQLYIHLLLPPSIQLNHIHSLPQSCLIIKSYTGKLTLLHSCYTQTSFWVLARSCWSEYIYVTCTQISCTL
jgi:hypothetical protein